MIAFLVWMNFHLNCELNAWKWGANDANDEGKESSWCKKQPKLLQTVFWNIKIIRSNIKRVKSTYM